MKKLVVLFFVLLSTAMFAQNKQQHYCSGIWASVEIAHEYCWFDTLCPYVNIDTSNHSNIWQNGMPQKTIFSAAYSAPKAMVTDILNPYPNNNDSYFDISLPTIIDSSYFFSSNTTLSFMHRINTDTMKDGGFIEVKYHKDSAWVNIAYDSLLSAKHIMFNCENLYSIQNTLFNGQAGFSGSSGWINTKLQWIWVMLVKEYPPDSIYLRFHFISDDINTNKDGWMIDNLEMIEYEAFGSLEEINAENLISISPNPVSESAVVEIKIQGEETYTAELYNIFGQKIKEFPEIKNNRFTIEHGNCKSGIYYLILKKGNNLFASKKIIFQ